MATILVVDDEFSILESIAEILEAEGYDVRTAGHGKLALNELEKGGIDLILADYMMPVMDGMALVEKVRESEAHRDLPVVMVSAVPKHLMPQPRQWNEYLGKPFEIDDLLATVARLLD